jgi:hypothetical protein
VGRLLTSRILYGVKTHTFCLQWSFGGIDIHKDENWKVRDWVYFIVNHPGLETLRLELTAKGTTQSFDLPLCVFSCNSLTQLIVKCKNVILEFPPSAFSPLFHAEIDLSVSDQHQYEPSPMCILNKVLHSMRMAKSLVLTTHFVQVKITLLSFYNNLYSTKGLI